MAPKKDAKGGKGKSKDGSDTAASEKGKGKGGGLKPATSINVRHILVRLRNSSCLSTVWMAVLISLTYAV